MPVETGDELGELVERPDRQRGRDERHEQDVGRVQHAFGQQRDAGRAVQDDEVVLVGQRPEQAVQPLGGLLGGVQDQVQVPVGEVGRQQVEPVEVGALDRRVELPAALDERLTAALDAGPDPQQEARRSLRVQVPQQHPQAVAGREVADVDRRRRLADPALDVVRGEDLHGRASAVRARNRCWLAAASTKPSRCTAHSRSPVPSTRKNWLKVQVLIDSCGSGTVVRPVPPVNPM